MPDISVIICTHNPRLDFLTRTLGALKLQTLPKKQWELLLIDNASKERLAGKWDLSWHPDARHVREDKLGLTQARVRGIKDSQGDLLIFVDDDNLLAPDFVERAAAVKARYSFLGAFGTGVIEPEFESPPPAELGPYLHMLALRTVPSIRWTNNPDDRSCLPWGAGLCVTRTVAERLCKFISHTDWIKVVDRRGRQLFCGGDDLFSWTAVEAGHGFGLFPEMRITHLISTGRVSPAYLLGLIHGIGFSHYVLHHLFFGPRQRQKGIFMTVRTLLHGMRRGRLSMQFKQAHARGEKQGEQFIAENQLRPLDNYFHANCLNSSTKPEN